MQAKEPEKGNSQNRAERKVAQKTTAKNSYEQEARCKI